jgi:hypothetical protein
VTVDYLLIPTRLDKLALNGVRDALQTLPGFDPAVESLLGQGQRRQVEERTCRPKFEANLDLKRRVEEVGRK